MPSPELALYSAARGKLIEVPSTVRAGGTKPKRIEDSVGRVNTKTPAVTLERRRSPEGWVEPRQAPEFDERTVVLQGVLRVESREATVELRAGQAVHVPDVHVPADQRVRCGTPPLGGAEYIALCIPASSPETVHRDRAWVPWSMIPATGTSSPQVSKDGLLSISFLPQRT